MDAWHLIRHLRVVTLHIITLLLESNRQEAAVRDLKSNLEKGDSNTMAVLVSL